MARYIDADALKERLSLVGVVADDLYGMGINRGLDRAETEIDMLPTANVVEVVRCKDCKYAKPMSFKGYFMCKRHHKYCRKADDFCSYGERK